MNEFINKNDRKNYNIYSMVKTKIYVTRKTTKQHVCTQFNSNHRLSQLYHYNIFYNERCYECMSSCLFFLLFFLTKLRHLFDIFEQETRDLQGCCLFLLRFLYYFVLYVYM